MIRINLDELTLNDAQGWIDPPEDYDENLNFWNGDHWQKGKGWVGPMPDHSGKDLRKPGYGAEQNIFDRRLFGGSYRYGVAIAAKAARHPDDMDLFDP